MTRSINPPGIMDGKHVMDWYVDIGVLFWNVSLLVLEDPSSIRWLIPIGSRSFFGNSPHHIEQYWIEQFSRETCGGCDFGVSFIPSDKHLKSLKRWLIISSLTHLLQMILFFLFFYQPSYSWTKVDPRLAHLLGWSSTQGLLNQSPMQWRWWMILWHCSIINPSRAARVSSHFSSTLLPPYDLNSSCFGDAKRWHSEQSTWIWAGEWRAIGTHPKKAIVKRFYCANPRPTWP